MDLFGRLQSGDLKVGDRVRRIHPYDGTRRAGRPYGAILTVAWIKDHLPSTGETRYQCVIGFEEDEVSWEFIWNLSKIED